MRSAVGAGVAYFAVVFAVGFLLGTLRVLFLAPSIGEAAAVLVELPVMLSLSWFACGWLLRALAVPGAWRHRLAMGAAALLLLMVAELGVSVFLFGRSILAHLAAYRSWHAAAGLAAQVAFAAFPLVRGQAGPAR
jgi:hypothetical protein